MRPKGPHAATTNAHSEQNASAIWKTLECGPRGRMYIQKMHNPLANEKIFSSTRPASTWYSMWHHFKPIRVAIGSAFRRRIFFPQPEKGVSSPSIFDGPCLCISPSILHHFAWSFMEWKDQSHPLSVQSWSIHRTAAMDGMERFFAHFTMPTNQKAQMHVLYDPFIFATAGWLAELGPCPYRLFGVAICRCIAARSIRSLLATAPGIAFWLRFLTRRRYRRHLSKHHFVFARAGRQKIVVTVLPFRLVFI